MGVKREKGPGGSGGKAKVQKTCGPWVDYILERAKSGTQSQTKHDDH